LLSSRVFSGAGLLLAGRIGANIFGFVSTIVLARILTPGDFGIVAISASFMAVLSGFFDIPTGAALIQLQDANDDDYSTAWTLSILKGLGVGAMLIALTWPITLANGDPRLVEILFVLAIYPVILGFRNAYFEVFAKQMAFGREVIIDVVSKFASLAVAVSIAIVFRNYWALILGMIASGLVSTGLSFVLAGKVPSISLKSFRRIFGLSGWMMASSVVNQVNWQSETFVAGAMFGQSTLGQTSVGGTFVNRIDEVSRAPLYRSLFSAFSLIQTDTPRLAQAYRSSQAFIVAVLLPIGVGLGATASLVVPLLLGPQWQLAVEMVAFCGPAVGLWSFTTAAMPLLLSLRQSRLLFIRDCAMAVVRVVFLAAGAFAFGTVGFMSGILAGTIVMLGLNAGFVKNLIGFSIGSQVANCHRSLISAAVMYASTFALSNGVGADRPFVEQAIVTGLVVCFGAVVYFAVHAALWISAGRPEGAESRIAGLLAQSVRRAARFLRVKTH
jgi:O-antigen/teichoic acid export membrane protein